MMTPEELSAFLDREHPALLGVVATLRADGSPQAVPVWYRWTGQAVTVWSDVERIWVKNIRRDPRVAFSAQEEGAPYAAVLMRGLAEVETGESESVRAEILAITRRYVPADEVEPYVARWASIRTIVTIRPETITSWTSAY